ncbi:MAG: DUF4388 domain-containing protein [Pyrinomonadaceae bacterium]
MALTGQLSDLSLAELIEFFCNQRKTGRLKVAYTRAPGYFFFERGELMDAKIGALSGVEAVYYALTLENASFKFSSAFAPTRRTIHQPWTQVALEGLRRLDEGIAPGEAFPEGSDVLNLYEDTEPDDAEEDETPAAKIVKADHAVAESTASVSTQLPTTADYNNGNSEAGKKSKPVVFGALAAAVVLIIAAVGVPAGWYGKGKPAKVITATTADSSQPPEQATSIADNNSNDSFASSNEPAKANEAAHAESAAPIRTEAAAAQLTQQRERAKLAAEKAALDAERLKAAAATKNAAPLAPTLPAANTEAAKQIAPKAAPKLATVQVTYDEAGRVTATSGGDGTAQRIARQKRFPAGKAGSATVTIPIN